MMAIQAEPLGEGPRLSQMAEMLAEQGYVDWAYERLDAMLEGVLARSNAGVHAAAAYHLWKSGQERADLIRTALADSSGLVVGRMDMTDEETWYVGRHPVDGDGGQPAVIDWRADLSRLFYQATRSFPAGIGRRRSIRMAGHRITGLSDETFVAGFVPRRSEPVVQAPPVAVQRPTLRPALTPVEDQPAVAYATSAVIPLPPAPEIVSVPDELQAAAPEVTELRAADLLLEDLARARTGTLDDIVATIQADQDRLARAPYNVPLIIQGGPGTGKTIVGLHRAAWVLYQQRERLIDQSVLVVGPNRRFIDYIGSVLPSLGETDVRQVVIDELALDSLSATERDRVKVNAVDGREVARVKGDGRMAAVIRSAVWSRVIPRKLSFSYGRFTLRLGEEQVESIIANLRDRGVPYRTARRRLSDALAQAFADEYVRRLGRRGPSMGGRELTQLMAAARSHLTTTGVLAEIQPKVEPHELVQRLFQSAELLERVGGVFTAKERSLLHRSPPVGRRRAAWTTSDLPLVDEAVSCIRGESTVSGHVVVDEAQDLSPMQWRVLARRTSQSSMTILGDLAQATSPWSPRSWAKVCDRASLTGRAEIAELTLGYRVPAQVMQFASPLLAAAAPGVTVPHSFRMTMDPVVRRTVPSEVAQVAADLALRYRVDGAVAVIAPGVLHDQIRESLGDAAHDVTVLEPEASKGLEFDSVVVVEPATIAGKTMAGVRLLYIALTRATKRLIVVHSQALPSGVGSGRRPVPPSTYPNPRNDDPWDNDAVHWLLDQPGGERWTRGVLVECLRRQSTQLARNRHRVDEAARFARQYGVVQEGTSRGRGSIIRLYRTDASAPSYPTCESDRRGRS